MGIQNKRRIRGMRQRRGVMVVLVAVLLIVFLVSVVFSVDVAYMQLTRANLRASTDAAARACGEALSRTQDMAQARQAAKDIALANEVGGVPLVLEDSDIVFGNSSKQVNGSWQFTAGGTPTNSVQIHGRRTAGSPSGSVPLFFGGLLGRGDFEPQQAATVVRLDRDLCLVVDRSSSMKLYVTDTIANMPGSDPRICQVPDPTLSRWSALSGAVDEFLAALNITSQIEKVGLVSYGSDGTWCDISNNKSDINQHLNTSTTLTANAMSAISATVFNGNTDIEAGISDGTQVLTHATHARPFAYKTMIVFTDGHQTSGGNPVTAATAAANLDIVVHTITFGDAANQTAMASVAAAGNGNHYHAPDAAALENIFREIAFTMPVVLTE